MPTDFAIFAESMELAASGAPLEGIFAPPASATELLRRCAVVDRFDREMWEHVLLPGLPEDDREPLLSTDQVRTFKQLVDRPEIEPVARNPGEYRLGSSFAQEYWGKWEAEKLTAFCRRVLQWFERTSATSQPDALRLLPYRLLTDTGAGLAELTQLFAEAENAFDLAQCDQLLRILEGAEAFRSELTPILQKLRARYQAKSLFADEFLQTVSYLDRATIKKAFVDFLTQEDDYFLQFHGPGGLGKTTALREWIARKLVPAGVPVAKVDFDLIEYRPLLDHPWLILWPIAQQLNRQLPGEPLAAYLPQLGSYSDLLRPAATLPPGTSLESVLQSLHGRSKSMGTDFARQFGQTLNACKLTTLVLLDTTEEPLLHGKVGLSGLLEFFQDLHDACPRLRVVLSGRYDIFAPEAPLNQPQGIAAPTIALPIATPPIALSIATHTVDLPIQPFSRPEALTYLRQNRHLEDGKHPLHEIVEASGGSPFKLALYAELALSRKGLTAEDLEQGTADFANLMRRVIDRIPEEEMSLRWLVRYGAIPRSLTRDYAVKVTLPTLERETQASEQDRRSSNPEALPAGARPYVNEEHWTEASTASLDDLWQRVRRYASARGWISYDSTTDTFTLQPDVRRPMRALVAKEEVWAPLQRESLSYFLDRAQSATGKSWVDAMAEAVYHALQLGEAQGRETWQAALREKPARDPALRYALAVTVRDLDGLQPGEFQTEVRFQVCLAAAAMAALEPAAERRKQFWWDGEFEGYYFAFGHLHPENERQLLHIGYWSGIGHEERALAETREVLALNLPTLGTLLTCVAASKLEKEEPDTARRLWLNATETSDGAFVPWCGAIFRRLAAWDASLDRLEEATIRYEKLRLELATCPDPASRPALYREVAAFYRSIGQPFRALKVLEEAASADEGLPMQSPTRIQKVLLYVELGDVETAEALVSDGAVSGGFDTLSPGEQGPRAEALGAMEALVLQFDAAHLYFDQAINFYSGASQHAEAVGCLLRQARMCIEEEGNYATAQRLLEKDPIRTIDPQTHPALHIQAKLTELRLAHLVKRKPRREIAEAFRELQSFSEKNAGPRLQGHIQATGLALGLCEPKDLVAKLEKISPPSARLEPLRVLQTNPRQGDPHEAKPRWQELFATAFAEEPIANGHPFRLQAVDFLRRAGLRQAAKEALQAFVRSDQPKVPVLRRQMHLAADWLRLSLKPLTAEELILSVGTRYAILSASQVEADMRAWRTRRPLPFVVVQRHHHELSSAGLGRSRFAVMALELLARYAWREKKFEAAKEYWEKAIQIYLQLGQNSGSLPSWLRPGKSPQAEVDVQSVQPAEKGRQPAQEFDDRIHVSYVRGTHAVKVSRFVGQQWEQREERIDFFAPERETHLAVQTTQLLEQWEKNERELITWATRVVVGPEETDDPSLARNCALAIDAGILVAFPWEHLAARSSSSRKRKILYRVTASSESQPDRRVAWMQQTLTELGESLAVDGIFGPLTAAALKRFEAAYRLTSAAVNVSPLTALRREDARWGSGDLLTLVSPRDHEKTSRRGGAESAAFASGLGLRSDNATLRTRTLSSLIGQWRPAVIHVCTFFVQGSHGEVMIPADPQPLSGESFGKALLQAYEGGPPPVVLLHIPRQPSKIENRRQILLRNLFGSELFETRGASAVFAYGQERLNAAAIIYGKFGRFMSRGPALGELPQEWRRLCGNDPEAESALWTYHPLTPAI